MKISVITPSFNQAAYLEETILSVLDQKYPDLEYIIIDGGSRDGSVDIIKKYEKHLAYWVSEPDSGQSNAINKGLQRASGDVITWLNSDDIFHPGTLHKVKSRFVQHAGAGLIHGGVILFNAAKELKTIYTYDAPSLERYLSGMVFSQPAAFFRKQYLDQVGLLRGDLHYGMDYDLFSRLVCVCSFEPVGDIFAKYRLHENSKSIAENDKFIENWKRVFVNLCKNLQWEQELYLLQQSGFYNAEINYNYPFTFPVNESLLEKADRKKVLFYHLSIVCRELYYTEQLSEARKLLLFLKANFPKKWIISEKQLYAITWKLKIPSNFLFLLKKARVLARSN